MTCSFKKCIYNATAVSTEGEAGKGPLSCKTKDNVFHSTYLIISWLYFLHASIETEEEWKKVSWVLNYLLSLMKLNNAWGIADCNNKYALKFLTMQKISDLLNSSTDK